MARLADKQYALPAAGRILAALGLLVLVGLASTAQLDSDEALSTSELALVVMFLAMIGLLVIGVGALAFGTYSILSANSRKLVAALLAVALVAILLALIFAPVEAPTGDPLPVPTSEEEEPELRPASDPDVVDAVATGIIAAAALVAAALVILTAIGILQRRRAAAIAEPVEDEEEAVAEAIDESLEDLRRERDVRRAIIACYARMERALARAGSARRPAEAPFEYLVRVLEQITANGPAARALTELFERAKFSVEPMGERDKHEAIGALELLRAEVSRPL